MRRMYLLIALCVAGLVSLTFAGAFQLTMAQDATPPAEEAVDTGMQGELTTQLMRPDGTPVGEITLVDEEGQVRVDFSNLQLEFAEYSAHIFEGVVCSQIGETIVTQGATPVPGPISAGTFVLVGTPTSIEATPMTGSSATVVVQDTSVSELQGSALVLTKVGGIDVIACADLEPVSAEAGASPEVEEVIATELAEELLQGTPAP